MPSISSKWTKTGSGFERDDELSLGVSITTADVHYHGDDVHVRPDVPKHAANAYQVYAVTDLSDPRASRVPLVNYADLSDAVTFATLVTRYVDHRNDVVAIEEIAEREGSHGDDWWPEGVVDGDEKPPRETLRAMLGTYAEQLDAALSS